MYEIDNIVQSSTFKLVVGLSSLFGSIAIVIGLIKSRRFRFIVYKYFLWPVWVTRMITKLENKYNSQPSTDRAIDTFVDREKLKMDLGMFWYIGKDKDIGPYCQTCYTTDNILQLLDVRLGRYGDGEKYRTYCSSHKESEQLIDKDRYETIKDKMEMIRGK